ncbi:MAG: PASTA domain-containing protein [Bacilli bacterium]|nr:PASTA domain-containing protein [Bacilli bacterium]
MKKRETNTNKIIINKFVFCVCLFLLLGIIVRICYLGLSPTIDGIDTKKLAENRNTKKEIIKANRGTIFDSAGDILAQNVSSYTVIAYLDESRSKDQDFPQHVIDIENTAKQLSPLLNMTEEELTSLLSKDLYQVELGPGGRGITEIKKEEIENLNLPGIDFIQDYKRYYPNGDFASYLIGYAKKNEDGNFIGEMGIEQQFNEELSGTNGYLEYQKDLMGYKIPNTPEIKNNPENGNDIYLTIDSSIQLFVEQALIDMKNNDVFEWATINIADANTGKILATSSTPSFDPNIKNMTSYLNPLTSYAFEPGSTMKIYTYMAALEKGTYDGSKTFLSGKKVIEPDTVNDWNDGKGWGTITYDQGFALSSNTGIANMLETMIDKNDLKDYFTKMGFGKKTGVKLPKELSGKISFKYPIEIANAGFGQGITTTPIQHIQALTSIANNGIMLQPYIIDKIVNSDTGEVIVKNSKEELGRVASESTIEYIKNLMYNVVHNDSSSGTGYSYKIEGYELIGKTGTAQVFDEGGKYSDDTTIRSFEGMFPKDNPEVIIYAAVKGSKKSTPLANAVKKVLQDTAKHLNIKSHENINYDNEFKKFNMPNVINKNVENSTKIVTESGGVPIILGNGTKIVSQYPKKGVEVSTYDKIFLLTEGEITLPNIMGYSKRDVTTLCNILNIKCNISGNGYVTNYNEIIENNEKIINIELVEKYASG